MKPQVNEMAVDRVESDATWMSAAGPIGLSDPVDTCRLDCSRADPPTHPCCPLSQGTFFLVSHRRAGLEMAAERSRPVVPVIYVQA